ncbi:MAG: AAA family ATPase [Agarilytica sp.]
MSSSFNEIDNPFFYTPSLKGLVQQVTHLAFFGDGMSVITGVQGSGKTSLQKELVKHFDQAHDVVELSLESDLELAECVESISSALGLRHESTLSVGELLTELRHFVQSLTHDKKLVILLVDEAQHLDDQSVGALVSLLQGGADSQAGLHLILLSEPGLDKRIDALQIMDVPVYRFDLPNFSPSELSTFLSQKVPDESVLNSSVVQKLWASSQGLPGRALDGVMGKPAKGKTPKHAKREGLLGGGIPFGHIAAIAVLAIVLLWSLVFRDSSEEALPVAKTVPIVPTPVTLQDDVEPLAQEIDVSTEQDLDAEVLESAPIHDRLSEKPVEALSAVGDSGAVADDQGEYESLISDASSEQSFQNETDLDTELNEVEPTSTIDIAPAVAVSVPVIEAESIQERPSVKALNDSEVFLMAQNSDFYTLQVIAASKKASLEAYVARQANRNSLYMYRGTREAKSWYVVVQGVYSTRESALKARASLPSEQYKAGPWPRKLSAIQEEIEEFRYK